MFKHIKHAARLSAGVSALAISAIGGFSAGVAAQDTADNEPVLEEITVTARRYEESLQDAPLSINVLSSDFLDVQRARSISDILELSPGATFVNFSKAQPEQVMRGVVAPTPGNSSSESSIQLVIDGMVLSKDFMKAPPIFDIDHVEVMRGPQGTTFGRNASIGLIHIVTKKPTREFEAGINFTAGNAKTYDTSGYVSGPVSDTLSARLAFNFDTEDGPTKSISTGKGLDGEANFAFRGSLIYEPTDSLSAYVKVEYSEDNDESPVRHGADCTSPFIDGPRASGFPVPPPHPHFKVTVFDDCDPFKTEISPDINFFLKRQILTVTSEIGWDVGDGIAVTAITGYMDGTNDSLADVLGTLENIVFQKVNNDGHLFSEEVRIDNHGSGDRLRWLAGVYFLTDQEHRFEENRFFQSGGVNPVPPPPFRANTRLATISTNKTDSIAVFGELALEVTDQLEVTGSGRFTHDSKDYLYSVDAFGFSPILAGVTGCNFPPASLCANGGFAPVPVSDNWSDFSGRITATYAVNDDNMVYLLWSQGFKSGGFQPDARSAAAVSVPFQPEHSNNYELGWKGEIQGRARFSLAGYYLKNKGTQIVTLIPVGDGFTGLIANVGAVESKGIEGEFTWLIGSSVRVGGNFALTDAQLANTRLLQGIDGNGNEIFNDVSGLRPDSAPRWTTTLYGEVDIHIPNGSVLTLRGDFQGRSNVFDDITERAARTRLRPQLTRFGAQAIWNSPDGAYRVTAWGKNINNDYDIENFGPRQPNTLQIPAGFSGERTYGVTVSSKF